MSRFEVLMIAGMVLVTFSVRYPVLALVGRVSLPPVVQDGMKFIPPAVLTAIIVPAVLLPEGVVDVSYTNAYLVAGIVAAFISWKTNKLLLTIVVGMMVLWGWRLLID